MAKVYQISIFIQDKDLAKAQDLLQSSHIKVSYYSLSQLDKLDSESLILLDSSLIKSYEKEISKSNCAPSVALYGNKISSDDTDFIYQSKVIDMIEGFPSSERYSGLIAKLIIESMLGDDLNALAYDHLIRSSIKVKNNRELINYLKNYLSFFSGVEDYQFIERSSAGARTIIGQKNSDLESCIKDRTLGEKYIGEKYTNSSYRYLPIHSSDGKSLWLCVKGQDTDKALVPLFFEQLEKIELYRSLKDSRTNLLELSNTDEITGLFNQRKLLADLHEEISIIDRNGEGGFSLLFIDIDHFKLVNDNHGHLIGSGMLIQLGQVFKKLVRSTDSVYRYGGDEFIILMRESKIDTVHLVATRILNKVKETKFSAGDDDYSLSVSIGISEFPKDAQTAKEIIDFADKMMYKSKSSGRGKIFHITEI